MGEKCFPNLRQVDNRIWKYRHIRNLSQQEIGELLSYKTSAPISNWEKGKKLPSLINAIRLSEILHTTVETLYPGLCAYLQQDLEAKKKGWWPNIPISLSTAYPEKNQKREGIDITMNK